MVLLKAVGFITSMLLIIFILYLAFVYLQQKFRHQMSSPHFMYHFDLESLGRAVAYSGTDAALYGYIL